MPETPDSAPTPTEPLIKKTDLEFLKNLKPEERKRVVSIVQQMTTNFAGPLPPPEMLAQYNQLIPNGADRLMKLLESETSHRQGLQKTLAVLSGRGQWLGFFLCLFFGAIGWHLSLNGHDWVAGVLFGTTIIGLVVVFVLGRVPREGKPTGGRATPKGKSGK